MRKWVFIIFIVILSRVLASGNPTLAVLDFENNSIFKADEYHVLSQGLAEILISEFDQLDAVQIVERRKLKQLLDELKLSQSGLTQEDLSTRVGKMLGVQYFVFGAFLVGLDDRMRIDARIVEVETGLTVKSQDVTGKTKQVLDLIQKLGRGLIKDLNIKGNRKKGSESTRSEKVDINVLVQFSHGVVHEDLGELKKAREFYAKALSLEPGFSQAQERLQIVKNRLQSGN
jgi:TolB-like protein